MTIGNNSERMHMYVKTINVFDIGLGHGYGLTRTHSFATHGTRKRKLILL